MQISDLENKTADELKKYFNNQDTAIVFVHPLYTDVISILSMHEGLNNAEYRAVYEKLRKMSSDIKKSGLAKIYLLSADVYDFVVTDRQDAEYSGFLGAMLLKKYQIYPKKEALLVKVSSQNKSVKIMKQVKADVRASGLPQLLKKAGVENIILLGEAAGSCVRSAAKVLVQGGLTCYRIDELLYWENTMLDYFKKIKKTHENLPEKIVQMLKSEGLWDFANKKIEETEAEYAEIEKDEAKFKSITEKMPLKDFVKSLR
ncbi:MAG: hypothetical protein ABIF92_02210 [archaeon]